LIERIELALHLREVGHLALGDFGYLLADFARRVVVGVLHAQPVQGRLFKMKAW